LVVDRGVIGCGNGEQRSLCALALVTSNGPGWGHHVAIIAVADNLGRVRVVTGGVALASLLEEDRRLGAVASLVALLGDGVTLLDAAASVLAEDHVTLGKGVGSIDLCRAVAAEGRLSIEDNIVALASEDAAVGHCESLAESGRWVLDAACASVGVGLAWNGGIHAWALVGILSKTSWGDVHSVDSLGAVAWELSINGLAVAWLLCSGVGIASRHWLCEACVASWNAAWARLWGSVSISEVNTRAIALSKIRISVLNSVGRNSESATAWPNGLSLE
jgi:hypothetical protein